VGGGAACPNHDAELGVLQRARGGGGGARGGRM